MHSCRFLQRTGSTLRQASVVRRPLICVSKRQNATSAPAALTRSDYLRILGLSDGATPADIKQAYYSLTLQLHPDKNPGDEEANVRFMAVLEAYERLNDVARNPADVISRMEKEREVTWKPNTANMDEIMEKARYYMEDHHRKLADDPATLPPPPEVAAHFRELTTQLRNIGMVAAAMLLLIGVIHSMETSS